MPEFEVKLQKTEVTTFTFSLSAKDAEAASAKAEEWAQKLEDASRDVPKQWESELDDFSWEVLEVNEE